MGDGGGRRRRRTGRRQARRGIVVLVVGVAAALFASLAVPQPAGAVPILIPTASPAVMLGGQLTDTVPLFESPDEPTGSLTFTLYGPGDPTCTGSPAYTNTQPVVANGDYTSDPFTPIATGTYRWVVTYAPEGLNRPAATGCGDSRQTVVVASGPVTPK